MAKIKILGLNNGMPTPFDGQYVVEYDPARPGVDPEGRPMIAHLVTTPDRAKAKEYATAADALRELRRSHGERFDGKPNRPLTAFTVVIV